MESRKFNKIIAVVIWYNPTEKEVGAVRLYNNDVTQVIIIDNSTKDNSSLCSSLKNVEYIPLLINRGIAYALNRGCERALQLGADWVLTMDQDSEWKTNRVADFVTEALQYDSFDQVGIFCPYHDAGPLARPGKRTLRFAPWDMVMTSGNLLRLEAWKQVNGFREDFFIDCVDDEIDCHLLQMGWQIIRCNQITLNHHLGYGAHHIYGTSYSYTPHPIGRYYYIGRNLQRMAQLYPQRAGYYHHRAWKELKRLCFYDWTDKWHKLRTYLQGWYEGERIYPTPINITLSPDMEYLREWLMTVPNRFFVEGQVIYNARNQIRTFTLPDGRLVNIKRFHTPAFINRFIYSFLRTPKAQRAYQNALLLLSKGIPTPQPIAYILCGNKLLNESYLITWQENLTRDFYEFRYHSVEGYEDVIHAFAHLSATMHQQGVLHLDYSPGNILWDKDPNGTIRFSIVDINRMRFDQKLSVSCCCRSFRRLWGHHDFIVQLSKYYASEMNWNEIQTQYLIEKYWKRFWHIRSNADIERVFSYEAQPPKAVTIQEPLVSVIVPNFNDAPFLAERLDSILEQTYRNIEVILLDDCSTDNSLEVMQPYRQKDKRITAFICSPANTGSPYPQWKKGIKQAKGKYIWIAEADDAADKTLLEKAVRELELSSRLVFVQVDSRLIDDTGKTLNLDLDHWKRRRIIPNSRSAYNGPEFVQKHMYWKNRIYNASGVVVRKDCITQQVLSTLIVPHISDWVFWSAIAMQGDILQIHERLNYFRQHTTSLTHSVKVRAQSAEDEIQVIALLQQMVHIPLSGRIRRVYMMLKRHQLHHRGSVSEIWYMAHKVLCSTNKTRQIN